MRCKIQALALIALEMALSSDFISNSSFADTLIFAFQNQQDYHLQGLRPLLTSSAASNLNLVWQQNKCQRAALLFNEISLSDPASSVSLSRQCAQEHWMRVELNVTSGSLERKNGSWVHRPRWWHPFSTPESNPHSMESCYSRIRIPRSNAISISSRQWRQSYKNFKPQKVTECLKNKLFPVCGKTARGDFCAIGFYQGQVNDANIRESIYCLDLFWGRTANRLNKWDETTAWQGGIRVWSHKSRLLALLHLFFQLSLFLDSETGPTPAPILWARAI